MAGLRCAWSDLLCAGLLYRAPGVVRCCIVFVLVFFNVSVSRALSTQQSMVLAVGRKL